MFVLIPPVTHRPAHALTRALIHHAYHIFLSLSPAVSRLPPCTLTYLYLMINSCEQLLFLNPKQPLGIEHTPKTLHTIRAFDNSHRICVCVCVFYNVHSLNLPIKPGRNTQICICNITKPSAFKTALQHHSQFWWTEKINLL